MDRLALSFGAKRGPIVKYTHCGGRVRSVRTGRATPLRLGRALLNGVDRQPGNVGGRASLVLAVHEENGLYQRAALVRRQDARMRSTATEPKRAMGALGERHKHISGSGGDAGKARRHLECLAMSHYQKRKALLSSGRAGIRKPIAPAHRHLRAVPCQTVARSLAPLDPAPAAPRSSDVLPTALALCAAHRLGCLQQARSLLLYLVSPLRLSG